ncbi:molybdopterin-binding oxidoreductase, partial [Streptomyces sp. NPDC056295]
MNSFRSTLSRTALGASAGLLAGFTALAVAELVAGLFRPAAGPVTVVGGAVIDRTPAAVKDFAIRTFGENDKVVLQLGILVVLALIAAGLGVLALRHRRVGASGILLFGLVGAAAALSRPDAEGVVDALPSLIG